MAKTITTDNTLNKGQVISLRLTPRQAFELSNIAKATGCRRSGLVRGMIDRLIEAHENQRR